MNHEKRQPMRQIPRKGDPQLNILIPKILKTQLLSFAKLGRHKLRDEVIKRLTATFMHDEAFHEIKKLLTTKLKTWY